MSYETEKRLLPMFPRTPHLPLNPNTGRDDLIATEETLNALCDNSNLIIEEKIDGASCGIVHGAYPIIRNRLHILNKAYSTKKTPAQQQFKPIWTWYYANTKKFIKLKNLLGFAPSVYGEWLYYIHTIPYDGLPDLWIAYDIYNPQDGKFISPMISRDILSEAGFSVPNLLHSGTITREQLLNLRDGKSAYSNTENREGIYIKTYDDKHLTGRYKMVRPEFSQREDWNNTLAVKNSLKAKEYH